MFGTDVAKAILVWHWVHMEVSEDVAFGSLESSLVGDQYLTMSPYVILGFIKCQ